MKHKLGFALFYSVAIGSSMMVGPTASAADEVSEANESASDAGEMQRVARVIGHMCASSASSGWMTDPTPYPNEWLICFGSSGRVEGYDRENMDLLYIVERYCDVAGRAHLTTDLINDGRSQTWITSECGIPMN
jgi:hypothetical protein